MNKFPDNLHVSQKGDFDKILFEEHLKVLRNELYQHIILGMESDFYDLDTFNRKYVKNIKRTHEMIDILVKELKELGWNTYLGFGDTGLYIYSTSKKPSNAW